jgi:hypothetical protein
MKTMTVIFSAITLLVLTAAFVNNKQTILHNRPANNTGKGFAVLELFTSEGCSSCPSADALLARIEQEAGNKPVYLLSYHVDYWNHLGWKDVFSDKAYSARQYQYSYWYNWQVYTPQLVINGQSECIGSDEPAVTAAIDHALADSSPVSLTLNAHLHASTLDIDYSVAGKTDNSAVLIALVQKHAVSVVKRGENEGRTLSHAQIVRQLYSFSPADKKQQVKLPEGFTSQDWEVIGMVQNKNTGVITAAAPAKVITN